MQRASARLGGTREDHIIKRVFLSPAVAVLLLFSIFPLFWSLGISFSTVQRGGTAVEDGGFLGLGFEVTGDNYARMPSDGRLLRTARNTLFFVFAGVTLQYLLGLALATLLNQRFFGRNLVRVIFLMPMMMTPVAAGYTGRMMFDSARSPIADLLRRVPPMFGLEPVTVPWLTDSFWAGITVVLIESWQWTPFIMLLLLAGLQSIPREIYEAARVDGASGFQIFRRITFPLLLPVSITAILIRGLEIFKIIDIIVVTTGGGPGSATESLTMYIFDTALTFGNYAYAAAVSYVLLVLVVVFSTVFLALGRVLTARTAG